MRILVDENIPRMTVRLKQPNRQRIHQRVMQALARFPQSQWPGMTVIMRDRVVSTWRSRRE